MTIRFKLTTMVIAVIVVANSLLSFLALQYLGHVWLGEVQTRVQRNLNAARAAYQGQMELIAAFLLGATRDQNLAAALTRVNPAEPEAVLRDLDASKRMDFIVLLGPEGKVVGRGHSPGKGGDLSADALVVRARQERQPVHGDKNQLQQVLVNLCLNACQAMADGGTLMVASRCDKGRVVVEVTDTGCGIKREHLDKIFEPFFTTKPVGKGTGLGLSVTYGIVQQHGGTLEVESQEGKGSTFRITLPAIPPPGDAPAPEA